MASPGVNAEPGLTVPFGMMSAFWCDVVMESESVYEHLLGRPEQTHPEGGFPMTLTEKWG